MIQILTSLLFMILQTTGHTVSVVLENIQSDNGTIKYAVFDNKDDFLKKPAYYGSLEVKEARGGFKITGLPAGSYAISMYQDMNRNDKLDKNMLGIPKEPYAFSNNAEASFGPPSFEECKIEITSNTQIRMKL